MTIVASISSCFNRSADFSGPMMLCHVAVPDFLVASPSFTHVGSQGIYSCPEICYVAMIEWKKEEEEDSWAETRRSTALAAICLMSTS